MSAQANTLVNVLDAFERFFFLSPIMMMIAFITMNGGLVPLIEGLCTQIVIIKDLRLSVVCVDIFCFSFSEEKVCQRKKQLVQDLISPPSICIHMCTLYTYTNTYMPRFSLSGFFGPSRCLILTPGPGSPPSTPSVQCVCVCACI